MNNKQWFVQRTNPDFVRYLSEEADITPAFAQILINRGMKDPAEVRRFLSYDIADLDDAFSLPGTEAAVEAIIRAARDGLRVMVHGDYDADGITATSILVESLRAIGVDTVYFIPNRFEHGYGFTPPGVERARKFGAGMIITVDCGVSSLEAVALAASAGMGVVITDHHEPMLNENAEPIIPEALAVINQKLQNPPQGHLSGAGVALKLSMALATRFEGKYDPVEFFDLAALGTLADSVPLIGENRIIVREGIRRISDGTRMGIRALKEVSGLNGRKLRSTRLAFTLVPRINAAGRISDATEVVELMLCNNEQDAMDIASSLDRKNYERQRIEETVFKGAIRMIEEGGLDAAIVLASEDWHEGVVGIVASKIAEKYNRPAFILSIKEGLVKGSARSVPGFDIHAGLIECSDLLRTFGGHKQAAGLSLEQKDFDAFCRRMSEVVSTHTVSMKPAINIDADLCLKDVNFRLVEEIESMEPFGYGNPEPLLGSKALEVVGPRIVGKNHLKMRLKSNSNYIDAIGFNMGDLLPTVEDTVSVDVAYAATINEWDDRRMLQLSLKALRKSSE